MQAPSEGFLSHGDEKSRRAKQCWRAKCLKQMIHQGRLRQMFGQSVAVCLRSYKQPRSAQVAAVLEATTWAAWGSPRRADPWVLRYLQ